MDALEAVLEVPVASEKTYLEVHDDYGVDIDKYKMESSQSKQPFIGKEHFLVICQVLLPYQIFMLGRQNEKWSEVDDIDKGRYQ